MGPPGASRPKPCVTTQSPCAATRKHGLFPASTIPLGPLSTYTNSTYLATPHTTQTHREGAPQIPANRPYHQRHPCPPNARFPNLMIIAIPTHHHLDTPTPTNPHFRTNTEQPTSRPQPSRDILREPMPTPIRYIQESAMPTTSPPHAPPLTSITSPNSPICTEHAHTIAHVHALAHVRASTHEGKHAQMMNLRLQIGLHNTSVRLRGRSTTHTSHLHQLNDKRKMSRNPAHIQTRRSRRQMRLNTGRTYQHIPNA